MCNQLRLKLWFLSAIGLKLTGTVMHVTGMVTNSWIENHNVSLGLFHACTGGDCSNLVSAVNNAGKLNFKDKVTASQTLAVLAILVAAGTFGLSVLQYVAEHLMRGCHRVRMCLPICSLVLALLSFFFITSCAIMVRYSDENMDFFYNDLDLKDLKKLTDLNIGFSLITSVVGGVLIALGGLMAAIYEKRLRALRKSLFDHAKLGEIIVSVDNGDKQDAQGQNGIELKEVGVESKVPDEGATVKYKESTVGVMKSNLLLEKLHTYIE